MDYREQVAHHEAAHVVVSYEVVRCLTAHGIDIDAPTSVPGSFGNAGVGKFVDDPTLPEKERRDILLDNVAITCAGAAADARTMGRSLNQALEMQPGDHQVAQAEIAQSPLIPIADRDPTDLQEERLLVLRRGLERARDYLDRPDVWARIERIAKACLANGGKLSKEEIEKLL